MGFFLFVELFETGVNLDQIRLILNSNNFFRLLLNFNAVISVKLRETY